MEELIKKAKKCTECNGQGGGNADYMNSDHNLERGTGDFIKCEDCNGTGEEQDEELVKERLFDNDEVIGKLQEYLVNEVREVDGRGITKDNCEDIFENWVESLDLEEIIEIIK